MATHTVLTTPQPSNRCPGYHYCYYDCSTGSGADRWLLVPRSYANLIKEGYTFDSGKLRRTALSNGRVADVLEIDLDAPIPPEPSLPPDRDNGWGDPDALVESAPSGRVDVMPAITSTTTSQRAPVAAAASKLGNGDAIPADLLNMLQIACRAQNIVSKLIGVCEKPRAMEAQKIAVTIMIQWMKANGIIPIEDSRGGSSYEGEP